MGHPSDPLRTHPGRTPGEGRRVLHAPPTLPPYRRRARRRVAHPKLPVRCACLPFQARWRHPLRRSRGREKAVCPHPVHLGWNGQIPDAECERWWSHVHTVEMRALDLFSGAGGLSCGFEWAGGTVVGGIEYDTNAAATFSANHPDASVWATDIRTVSPQEVRQQVGEIDVILGGPMCQGFSQRGPRNPHEDPRNFAFWSFAKFVRDLQPKAFLVENVPALVSDVHNRALAIAVFEELEDLGYHLSAEVVNAAWFGVPQLRYRLLIIGSKDKRRAFPRQVERGLLGSFAETSYTTVEDAIADLPPIEAGGGLNEAAMPRLPGFISGYGRLVREGADALHNHWSSDTDEVNLRRIRFVPEGGNWHDIPEEFLPPRFLSVRQSDHTTTYRRLSRLPSGLHDHNGVRQCHQRCLHSPDSAQGHHRARGGKAARLPRQVPLRWAEE